MRQLPAKRGDAVICLGCVNLNSGPDGKVWFFNKLPCSVDSIYINDAAQNVCAHMAFFDRNPRCPGLATHLGYVDRHRVRGGS